MATPVGFSGHKWGGVILIRGQQTGSLTRPISQIISHKTAKPEMDEQSCGHGLVGTVHQRFSSPGKARDTARDHERSQMTITPHRGSTSPPPTPRFHITSLQSQRAKYVQKAELTGPHIWLHVLRSS